MLEEHPQQLIGTDRLNERTGLPSRDRFLGSTDAFAELLLVKA